LATVRVVTFNRVGAPPEILLATFRMPTGESRVDNFSAGGVAAPVDVRSGRLGTAVGKSYEIEADVHPTSGSPIHGVVLPDWSIAKALVIEAHKRFGELAFVGWDVALTTEGPVLIEANPDWGGELLQMPNRTALGDTVFPQVLAEHVADLQSKGRLD
jgi:hypothetical protein